MSYIYGPSASQNTNRIYSDHVPTYPSPSVVNPSFRSPGQHFNPDLRKYRPPSLPTSPTTIYKTPQPSSFTPSTPPGKARLHENGFPKSFTRIPQLTYCEPPSARTPLEPTIRPPVVFQQIDSAGLGVRVGDILESKANNLRLPLLNGEESAFDYCDGEIKLRISWPGYRLDPSEQRVSTRGGYITREALLESIAKHVNRFTEEICRLNIPVERGIEHWAIGMHPSGKQGIKGTDVLITALYHCGRSNWQAELWLPDEPKDKLKNRFSSRGSMDI